MKVKIRVYMAVLVAVLTPELATTSEDLPPSNHFAGPMGQMSLSMDFRDLEFTEKDGRLRIEGEEFGELQDPGKPLLPSRTSLLLLPPGARAIELTVKSLSLTAIPGTYTIMPTPPVLPISGGPDSARSRRESLTEWEQAREDVYSLDRSYPDQVARIAGSGSLDRFAYVAVTFAPFSYRPQSQRLVRNDHIEVQIRYVLQTEGERSESNLADLPCDQETVARATSLFDNYHQMAPLYEHPEPAAGNRDELYDYLIITTPNCETAIEISGFLEWKISLGFNPRVMLTTDLEITSQPGNDLPARIRNFLRLVYGPWGVEYLLLVGTHESIPMRYCFPDPANHQHNPGSPGDPGGSKPTDCYYADLSLPDDESWDLDGDGFYGEYGDDIPDFLTELAVGRIPSSVPGDIHYTLQKIISYEEDTGDWKDRALHGGAILFHENQDGMDIPFRDGAVLLDMIESDHMQDWLIDHYCEHEGLVPSSYDWPALTQTAFTAAWRGGQWGVVNWAGHGNSDDVWRLIWTWDDGDGVFNTDGSDGYDWLPILRVSSTLDDDYPSIVWAVSCSVGYPEIGSYGNLGIDLLTRPGFGAAVGIISASRSAHVTAYWPDVPGGTETKCLEFNRFLIDGPSGPRRLGDAHFDSKFHCFVNYGLTTYKEYTNQYVLNLYGDPAMDRKGPVQTGTDSQAPVTDNLGLVLLPNQPNPFNPKTLIRYHLPQASWVEVSVHSVDGRRVALLQSGDLNAGWHELAWNGTTESGAVLPSGIYLSRVTSSTGTETRKMTLLK